MSKPTLYRNRLIPLESILLTNDEILYHDDKKNHYILEDASSKV